MKVLFHFSVAGFSNTYIVGPDGGGDAIIIDPGSMNVALLNLIEANGYYARYVLLTHSHDSHVGGIRTLRKIYNFETYAAAESVMGCECTVIPGGETVNLGELSFEALSLQGHSRDSVVFIVGSCIFSGDVMGAGTLGSAPNGYARELLKDEIRSKILSRKVNYYLFPGHGAPSTLEAERLTNPIFADLR